MCFVFPGTSTSTSFLARARLDARGFPSSPPPPPPPPGSVLGGPRGQRGPRCSRRGRCNARGREHAGGWGSCEAAGAGSQGPIDGGHAAARAAALSPRCQRRGHYTVGCRRWRLAHFVRPLRWAFFPAAWRLRAFAARPRRNRPAAGPARAAAAAAAALAFRCGSGRSFGRSFQQPKLPVSSASRWGAGAGRQP